MKIENGVVILNSSAFQKSRVVSIETESSFRYSYFEYKGNKYYPDSIINRPSFLSDNTEEYPSVHAYHLFSDDTKEDEHFLHDEMVEAFHSKSRPGICTVKITYNLEFGGSFISEEIFDITTNKENIGNVCQEKNIEVLNKYQKMLFIDKNRENLCIRIKK